MSKRKFIVVLGVVALVLSGCAVDRLHREALIDTANGDYEIGIAKLEEAARLDPGDMGVRLDLKSQRDRAIAQLMAIADEARAAGRFEDALSSYNRVLSIDARSGRALRGLEAIENDQRHAAMLIEAQEFFDQADFDAATVLLRSILAESPGEKVAQALLNRIDAAQDPPNVTPVLRTLGDAPVTLQFRDADTSQVFEVLSRQTGVNFVFDSDVSQNTQTTIFVQRVSIEEAIDLILRQNQLARQVMSENMVLIYPNTPAKIALYQDEIVRTFYLTNSDPQQFSEVLRTMLNIETIYVDARANAVVVRDTPEIIRMAEHLIASLDLPEPEVMMEVEVLEVTRSRLQQLGIGYPSSFTINPTPLAGDPLVLADLRNQDSTTLTVTPVPITLDLRKEVGVSNLLASPRIRARNRERAEILIGQRVPVITNSVTPTATGAAVVTGSVQYVDVGLTLSVEPTIYLDGTVAINIDFEISNIIREIFNSTSGTLAYQIGTRNASTILRLKDGETQVLAGLIQDTERDSSSRIPGLGDIPLIGRLFGSYKNDDEETEIILSITPRIIRSQSRPSSQNVEFWYGTQANARSGSAGAGATRFAASRIQPPATGEGAGGVVAGATGGPEDGGNAGTRDNAPPPPERLTLDWDGPGQVAVGQEFEIDLALNSVTELSSLRTELRYDGASLQLIAATAGELIPSSVTEQPEIQERGARVRYEIESLGDATISGSGSLLRLRFRALSPRPATMVSVQQFAAGDEDGLAVPVMAPRPFVVVVTP